MRVFETENQRLNTGVSSGPAQEYGYQSSLSTQRTWVPSKKTIIGTSVALGVFAVLVFGLVFGIPASSSSSSSEGTDIYSAPVTIGCQELAEGNFWDYLAPDTYEISIHLEPQHFIVDPTTPGGGTPATFTGTTAITFNVTQPSSCVVLHADQLNFSDITITPEGTTDPISICSTFEECTAAVQSVSQREVKSSIDLNLIAIDFSALNVILDANSRPSMKFNYTGPVGSTPTVTGLHRSAPFAVCDGNSSTAAEGEQAQTQTQSPSCKPRALIATQLERTGARKLFPSYDMPAAKARFTVTVVAPVAEAPVILSNMNEAGRTLSDDGQYVEVEFNATPLMSTYLVAIAVGELRQVTGVDGGDGANDGGFTVRGWTVPGRETMMQQAVSAGYTALNHYNQLFTAVEQPVIRYNFVALPGKQYAMENWGLLIFDEARALYNSSTSGSYGRVRTASVVCHEVAHQWIGNLATCASWEQLVVNEGLASEEEYDCMTAVAPDLPGDVLRYRIVTPAGELPSPHDGPLSTALFVAMDPLMPPASPASDLQLSDATAERVVYAKGAAVYMLHRYVFDELLTPLGKFWYPSMNAVLAKHQFSTMVYSDIVEEMMNLLKPIYDEKVGPGKLYPSYFWAAALTIRSSQLLAANNDIELERQIGSNGTAPLGSWMYTAGYPFIDTTLPNLIDPTDNFTQSSINISSNQTRFCFYDMSTEQASEWGLEQQQVDRIQLACEARVPFVNVLAMANLTDCPDNKNTSNFISTASGPYDAGPVDAEAYILNQNAVRLWRTFYSELHFSNLVTEAAQMSACPAAADTINVNAGSDGYCCAAAGDMLEVAGVLSDAGVFAAQGKYPASWAMKMVEAMGRAPVVSTGLGQYLLLLPALEMAESLRGYAGDNETCAAQWNAFYLSLIEPQVETIKAAALAAGGGAAATPGAGDDTSQEALLAKLAESPLLRRAAHILTVPEIIPDAAAAPQADGGGGRRLRSSSSRSSSSSSSTHRRRLLQDSSPAPAPVGGDGGGAPAPSPEGNAAAGDTPPSSAPTPSTTGDLTPAPAPSSPPSLSAPTLGNAALQTELCALLPSTPLWINYIATSDGETTTTTTPPTTQPSADLLPAIYGVAAAMPSGCRSALETAYASTSLPQNTTINSATDVSDVALGVRYALKQCWLQEGTYAEASRCLYALTKALDPLPFTSTPLTGGLGLPLDKQLLYYERTAVLKGVLMPWLVATTARQSPAAWLDIVNALSDGSLWDAMGGADKACEALDVLPLPTNSAQIDALEGLMADKGRECSLDVRGRTMGKMQTVKDTGGSVGESMCAFLDDWQNRQV